MIIDNLIIYGISNIEHIRLDIGEIKGNHHILIEGIIIH